MRTADFHYDLPEDAIAQSAVEPRDSSRLLDTRDLSDHLFGDLPILLRPGDLVVVNRTRVRRARLFGRKADTGGKVELLLLRALGDGTWEALARPSRRLRAGSVIDIAGVAVVVRSDPVEGRVVIDPAGASLEEAAARAGELPLPPYFRGHLDDPDRYQTVYAEDVGSAAAPTAGLHFTPHLLSRIEAAGIDRAAVDLEVGVDTFRPIAADDIGDHVMHRERVVVTEPVVTAVGETRRRGGRVVAVGTTVVRSLEAAAAGGELETFDDETDLFITPGYEFRVVDLLITNFHVPSSTLIVLVASFMGPAWRDAYAAALGRGYRFLSFGDAMLAERSP